MKFIDVLWNLFVFICVPRNLFVCYESYLFIVKCICYVKFIWFFVKFFGVWITCLCFVIFFCTCWNINSYWPLGWVRVNPCNKPMIVMICDPITNNLCLLLTCTDKPSDHRRLSYLSDSWNNVIVQWVISYNLSECKEKLVPGMFFVLPLHCVSVTLRGILPASCPLHSGTASSPPLTLKEKECMDYSCNSWFDLTLNNDITMHF